MECIEREMGERDGEGSGSDPGRNRTQVTGTAVQCPVVQATAGPASHFKLLMSISYKYKQSKGLYMLSRQTDSTSQIGLIYALGILGVYHVIHHYNAKAT